MKHRTQTWLSSGLLLAYTLTVLCVGLLPGNGGIPSLNDKVLHFSVFGGMGLLALFTFRATFLASDRIRTAVGLWAFLFTAAVGAALELLQAYVPSRQADVGDWLADCAGAAPAIGLGWLWLWWVDRAATARNLHH